VNLFFKEFHVVRLAMDASVPTMDVTLLPNAVIVLEFLIRSAALPIIPILRIDLNPLGRALITARFPEVTSVADIDTGIEPDALPVILKLTFDLIASGRAKIVCRFAEVTSAVARDMTTEDTLLAKVEPIRVFAAVALIFASVSETVIEFEPILVLLLIAVEFVVRLAILSLILILALDLIVSGNALIVARFSVVKSVAPMDIATEDTLVASVVPMRVFAAASLIFAKVSNTVMELEAILLLLLIAVAFIVRLAILSFKEIDFTSVSPVKAVRSLAPPEKLVTATP
jgi:hypothetical protein